MTKPRRTELKAVPTNPVSLAARSGDGRSFINWAGKAVTRRIGSNGKVLEGPYLGDGGSAAKGAICHFEAGLLSRGDGMPAVIRPSGKGEWWIDGSRVDCNAECNRLAAIWDNAERDIDSLRPPTPFPMSRYDRGSLASRAAESRFAMRNRG